jgi:hypothetical protein
MAAFRCVSVYEIHDGKATVFHLKESPSDGVTLISGLNTEVKRETAFSGRRRGYGNGLPFFYLEKGYLADPESTFSHGNAIHHSTGLVPGAGAARWHLGFGTVWKTL